MVSAPSVPRRGEIDLAAGGDPGDGLLDRRGQLCVPAAVTAVVPIFLGELVVAQRQMRAAAEIRTQIFQDDAASFSVTLTRPV